MRRVLLGVFAGLVRLGPRAPHRPCFLNAFPKTLLVIVTLSLSSTVALSGFDKGVTDYRAGKYNDAFKEWVEAAQQGDVDAQYNIGCLYVRGEGVPQSEAFAKVWLRQAADAGDLDAATWLANLETDDARKKYFSMRLNPNRKFHITFAAPQIDGHAMRWPCATDEKNGAQIEFTMGLMFEKGGMGPPQDDKQAAEWYRRASDRNFAEAQTHLAYNFAEAQTHLAYMYIDGRGVEQDLIEAGRLFFKAAEDGNALAQANLGASYSDGFFGFAKDPVLGYVLVSHAADAGNKVAKDYLPKLVARMSVPQFFEGQKLAETWKGDTPWPAEIAERIRSPHSVFSWAALIWPSALGILLFVTVIVVRRSVPTRSDAAQH